MLPPALDSFVARCLEMEEEKRVQTAEEARDELVHIRTACLLHERAPLPAMPGAARGPGSGSINKATGPKVLSTRVQQAHDQRLLRRLLLGVVAATALAAVGFAAIKSLPKRHRSQPKEEKHQAIAVQEPVLNGLPVRKKDPETGWVHVSAEPGGATVIVDGKEHGKTPADIKDLALGVHTIRIVPEEGSGAAETVQEVEITPGENRPVTVRLSAAPTALPEQPGAQFDQVDAKSVTGRTLDFTGLKVSARLRVLGASGKPGVVGVFFYSLDGKPLPQSRGNTSYQSQDGQLAVFVPFHSEAAVTDYPTFNAFVPLGAFPENTTYDRVLYRVEVFVDNKLAGQTNLLPAAKPGA
jgi:hypothetical protein